MKIEKGKAYKALFSNNIYDKDEVVVVKSFGSDVFGMTVVFEGKERPCPTSAFFNIFEPIIQ